MSPEPISPAIIGEREKFLLYGDPGMGKTFCALTLPEPIYFLAIGGPNEAKTYYSEQFQKKHGKKEILLDFVGEKIIKGRVEAPSAFDDACIKLDEALELDQARTQEFASIVVDNATALSEFQMNKVIEIGHTSRNPEAKGFSTYEKFMKHGILTPFDAEWGASQSLMQKFVSWIFSLDKHVALVGHEYDVTVPNRATQGESLIGVKPLFIGKQRDRIANMFDNVWRFTKQGQLYIARTMPQDKPFTVIAKTRVGGVVDHDYIDPDLSDTIKQFQKYAAQFE